LYCVISDIDGSKLTVDDSVLETTGSDSFSFINLKETELSPEGTVQPARSP